MLQIIKNNFRLIYLIIILSIDFLYVYISKDVYGSHFSKNISNSRKLIGLVASYIFMGLGWYFLVATKIEYLVHTNTKYTFMMGVLCGFLYACIVYGLYNSIMYATIYNWKGYIITRDVIWGFGSSMLFGGIYALITKNT